MIVKTNARFEYVIVQIHDKMNFKQRGHSVGESRIEKNETHIFSE